MKKINYFISGILIFVSQAGNTLAADIHSKNYPEGARIYNETCVACHGETGEGEFSGVPNFNSANGPLSKSDDVLKNNIINGFTSPGSEMGMPALGGNPDLTEKDVGDVLVYLRTHFQKKKQSD